ncbi:ketosteroid isomerase-like protein [Flavobacterium sp. HSC-32F16]|uniref:nuclear transport factor 2 family protein n=1 Tax=Flavobacterium sp. HSC-32F16 TaxID=2910964 RepID=UPI0020A4221C|nr:nuclear transport factor 2 family protein [Flavobacterium sp. HSC-32F16]MCP2027962.1 ketosteroid isomerase-like protein [Flavobacterium sp. HSC-32F16]
MKKDSIVTAEIELLTAIRNSDIAVLDKTLHDDLLFNMPDGQTITKEFDLNSYRSGKMKVHSLEASDQIINVIHDSAVVTVTVSLKGTYDNNPINGVFKYIRVWKKIDDDLKVIAGSCVQLA